MLRSSDKEFTMEVIRALQTRRDPHLSVSMKDGLTSAVQEEMTCYADPKLKAKRLLSTLNSKLDVIKVSMKEHRLDGVGK